MVHPLKSVRICTRYISESLRRVQFLALDEVRIDVSVLHLGFGRKWIMLKTCEIAPGSGFLQLIPALRDRTLLRAS